MTIRDVPWTNPLKVTLRPGLERTFGSVYEALDFLENEWPLKRGERYGRAVSSCKRALNRMTPAAVAREAFVAACLEAGMPAVMTVPLPYDRSGQRGISAAVKTSSDGPPRAGVRDSVSAAGLAVRAIPGKV